MWNTGLWPHVDPNFSAMRLPKGRSTYIWIKYSNFMRYRMQFHCRPLISTSIVCSVTLGKSPGKKVTLKSRSGRTVMATVFKISRSTSILLNVRTTWSNLLRHCYWVHISQVKSKIAWGAVFVLWRNLTQLDDQPLQLTDILTLGRDKIDLH